MSLEIIGMTISRSDILIEEYRGGRVIYKDEDLLTEIINSVSMTYWGVTHSKLPT